IKINRQIAAGIDQRIRQLAGQNLSDSALVDQMVGYMADLGSGASRDILVATRPLFSRSPFLPECHHPFGLPRPTAAPTAAAKRELPLANAMGQLDASDRDGRVRERLEPSHRRTASLDRPMILLDDVVQILAGPHLDVPPARMVSAQHT